MRSLWYPCPVLPGCGARLTDTGLVSQGLSAPPCGEVGVFNIHFGRQQSQVHWMDAGKGVKSPGDKDTDSACTVEASPLSCSSVPSNSPGAPTRCQKLFRAWTHVVPSSKICKVKSSKVLKVKMLSLYFATVLLGGKVFEAVWC